MKKLLNTSGLAIGLILVGLTFMNVDTTNAQPNIGVKGGVDFATLNVDNFDFDSRTGLLLGAYTNITMTNSPVTIQPELLYIQKGGAASGNINLFGQNAGTADFTYKFDYIEIPVLAKMSFGGGGSSVVPYAAVGPYIGFNINAEVDVDVSGGGSGTQDVSDEINSTDFGLALDVGATMDNSFRFGARYDLGLSEVIEDSDVNNSAFMLTAGYSF